MLVWRRELCLIVLLGLSVTGVPVAQGESILEDGAKVNKVADGCKFTEGPALGPDGAIYFSDSRNDRIMKLSASGKLSEFRKPARRTNGMIFDAQGRLIMSVFGPGWRQANGPAGSRRQ